MHLAYVSLSILVGLHSFSSATELKAQFTEIEEIPEDILSHTKIGATCGSQRQLGHKLSEVANDDEEISVLQISLASGQFNQLSEDDIHNSFSNQSVFFSQVPAAVIEGNWHPTWQVVWQMGSAMPLTTAEIDMVPACRGTHPETPILFLVLPIVVGLILLVVLCRETTLVLNFWGPQKLQPSYRFQMKVAELGRYLVACADSATIYPVSWNLAYAVGAGATGSVALSGVIDTVPGCASVIGIMIGRQLTGCGLSQRRKRGVLVFGLGVVAVVETVVALLVTLRTVQSQHRDNVHALVALLVIVARCAAGILMGLGMTSFLMIYQVSPSQEMPAFSLCATLSGLLGTALGPLLASMAIVGTVGQFGCMLSAFDAFAMSSLVGAFLQSSQCLLTSWTMPLELDQIACSNRPLVESEDVLDRDPSELSHYQRQRVAIQMGINSLLYSIMCAGFFPAQILFLETLHKWSPVQLGYVVCFTGSMCILVVSGMVVLRHHYGATVDKMVGLTLGFFSVAGILVMFDTRSPWPLLIGSTLAICWTALSESLTVGYAYTMASNEGRWYRPENLILLSDAVPTVALTIAQGFTKAFAELYGQVALCLLLLPFCLGMVLNFLSIRWFVMKRSHGHIPATTHAASLFAGCEPGPISNNKSLLPPEINLNPQLSS